MLVGDGTGLVELGGVERDGLLAKHVLAGGQRGTQIGDMRVVRRGDIDGIDVRIGIEIIERVVHLLNAILLGKRLGLGKGTVGNASELAAGKGEGLSHLVGDNAAADHSPTEFGGRKNVVRERLVLNRSERCLCGCRGIERSLFGICHECLLSHWKSFISDSSIFAQIRVYVRTFAHITAKRSLFDRKRRIYTHVHAITREHLRTNAQYMIFRNCGEIVPK